MRARHLSVADQSFFLFDHLEGEAREEVKYRSAEEREDHAKLISALKDVYGCSQSYVALQEAFFSRLQQEGETLLEFSLALMGLLEKAKQRSPDAMPNAEVLLRDQFVEHVLDSSLRRELKQLVRRQPTATLRDVRGEAIRWEHEGTSGGARGRSHSAPLTLGFQYGVRGDAHSGVDRSSVCSEMSELREMLKLQQQQHLTQLTQSVAQLRDHPRRGRPFRSSSVICRRCQKPGHFAAECDGERVPPHSLLLPHIDTRVPEHRPSRSGSLSENYFPPSCWTTAWLGTILAQTWWIMVALCHN